MKDRQSVFVGIFASIAFAFAFTSQVSAGYFPPRPTGAKLTTFSGVLVDYGIGNGLGGFYLVAGSRDFNVSAASMNNGKIFSCSDLEFLKNDPQVKHACADWPGSKVMDFNVGATMTMNGKVVTCTDPELKDDTCTDWPSWLAEGKTYVTATCWQDTDKTWFCDEIDKAAKGGH